MVASLIILCMLCMGNAETHSRPVESVYVRADHSCGASKKICGNRDFSI